MSSAPAPVPHIISPWRWWVCILLMFATVINYMDRMALNQLALRIQFSLGLNNTQYSYLESAFSFAFAFGAILTGTIVDRTNVRWLYPVLVLGWSAAGVLTGYATTFWMLLSCRLMLGLFEAGNWPCGLRTTRAVLRPAERSFGNALFQSGTALGAVITPLMVLFLLRWVDPQEPFRNAAMSVTGGSYAVVVDAPTDNWKFPFRVIGCFGVLWVIFWFVTVPGRLVASASAHANVKHEGAMHFSEVLRDRRFWILLASVVAINITWHGFRTWLPLYLQKQRGFSESEMSRFTTAYYLIADVGSWTIGLGTLLLCRRGVSVHGARILSYGVCAALTMCCVAVPFLSHNEWIDDAWVPISALTLCLLVVAFGGLGLFPTYYSLTQELSSKHQGKVSGTLGACAHLSLAMIYPLEGMLIDATGSYELILGLIGVAPALAFVLLLTMWPKSPPEPAPAS